MARNLHSRNIRSKVSTAEMWPLIVYACYSCVSSIANNSLFDSTNRYRAPRIDAWTDSLEINIHINVRCDRCLLHSINFFRSVNRNRNVRGENIRGVIYPKFLSSLLLLVTLVNKHYRLFRWFQMLNYCCLKLSYSNSRIIQIIWIQVTFD